MGLISSPVAGSSRRVLVHVAEGSVPAPKPRRSSLPTPDPTERVLRYLARRDRTEAQVTAFLERQGAPPNRIRALVREFRRRGYLNDEAYALRWARARLARRPMGRARLEAELLGQGLGRATAARTLDLLYGEISERDLARDLLNRRGALGTPAGRSREAGLLRRHGFDEETIRDVLGWSSWS